MKKRFKLTDKAGKSWTWTEDELDDTLFESEHWETKKTKVRRMKVGAKIKSGGEVLERLKGTAKKNPPQIWSVEFEPMQVPYFHNFITKPPKETPEDIDRGLASLQSSLFQQWFDQFPEAQNLPDLMFFTVQSTKPITVKMTDDEYRSALWLASWWYEVLPEGRTDRIHPTLPILELRPARMLRSLQTAQRLPPAVVQNVGSKLKNRLLR